jgi:hypothetical protein
MTPFRLYASARVVVWILDKDASVTARPIDRLLV